jgi:hypothetical protein
MERYQTKKLVCPKWANGEYVRQFLVTNVACGQSQPIPHCSAISAISQISDIEADIDFRRFVPTTQ